LLDWGLVYDELNQPQQALEKLQQSAALKPTALVYSQIGMLNGKLERWPDALAALDVAEKLDPSFPETYVFRAKVYIKTNQWLNALQDDRRALGLDPNNSSARHDLQVVVNQVRANSAGK
jgi:tetratricopeptide (TPR) repeat protein